MIGMTSDTIAESEARFISNHNVQGDPVPEIPSHWIFERDEHPLKHTYFCWWPFFHFLHHLFCIIGLGHASLHHVWEVSYPGCPADVWGSWRDTLRERLQHINIVAGLLLTAMVGFCTTEAPVSSILPYTTPSAYYVLSASVALSLGGLIVGSAAVFAFHKARVDWFRETMMGSRPRIWATMILLSFPFVLVGVSTCTAATGLLVAAFHSEVKFVRASCYLLVIPPLSCGIVFGWMLCMKTGAFGRFMTRLIRLIA